MAAVVANYDINISEITANMKAEGVQSPEMEAILKATADDAIWNTIERFKGMDMSNKKKMINNMMGSGGRAQLGIPLPEPVNPTDPHVITIAKLAVEKHNENAGTSLVFIQVIGGLQWNLLIGALYMLIITTQDSKGTYTDYAVFLETCLGQKYLLWYKH
ncbi:cysteine proteinase inhibitor 4-like [Coffea eugenioides]|uniref:cysteine proteinase inhibitor 4-like n=1 Tax=Coffea eugenioides TaxID=49369 RepID=UPI000F611CA2|nr:cysteine proteinase inhibitor 4-like [Coffea eugenioides]